ncbi:GAF domain-containing protein [Alteribacillus sp. YIM 98480]|uniref:GAF domain-containing protein n=1 Tax=Alteribacillus sp. YIM 98480 TaxID=2606599 RepID=UPI00131CD344|nr:GAF domain-containing protein [Alteribacillus sp. YIM 98480]
MTISTDLASIHILSSVYQSNNISETFSKTVNTLCEKVDYINWAGIYLHENEETRLHAFADDGENMQSQLAFPIKNRNKEIGVLVVKSKQWIVFDVTDVSTLETVASELGDLCT